MTPMCPMCPTCGGRLQGSILMSVDVTTAGVEIVAVDDLSPRWYCENDHELSPDLVKVLRHQHLKLDGITVCQGRD